MADEGGDVAGEEALGELAHHRMLDIGLGDERAIDVLPVLCSPAEDAASLYSCHDSGDCCLRQLTVGVQLLPDLRDRQLPLFPEEAKDGDLELGQRLTIGHYKSSWRSTSVDSTGVERNVKSGVRKVD